MSEPRSPSRAKNVLFTAATLLLVYVLVEGAVWLAYPSLTGSGFRDDGRALEDVPSPDPTPGREAAGLGFRDPAMSIHPYLGYVYTPRPDGNEGHVIPINEDGFLDPKTAIRERRPDRFLVGVMGGSVAGQLGTFHAAYLEEALRDHPLAEGKTLEFVWLGVPGYHQPQQVIQLSWILAQGGALDLLINLDGFNELAVPAALNAPQGAHPLFPMNWSMVSLDVPDPELRRHLGALEYLKGERQRKAADFAASFGRASPLARLWWKRQDQRLEAQIGQHAWALQQFDAEAPPFFVRGPERDHVPTEELLPRLVSVWQEGSRHLNAICAARDIVYLHVLQPNQYDPDSKPLSALERETAYDAEGPYRPVIEAGYPMLREAGAALRDEGILFVDLSDVFAETTATLYKDNCCHFNAEGNRLVAGAIGRAAAELL